MASESPEFSSRMPRPLEAIVRDLVAQGRRLASWSDADIASLVGEERVDTFRALPLNLQDVRVVIGTHGERRYVSQRNPNTNRPLVCPGSSLVFLEAEAGTMDIGWGSENQVDPGGHFINGPNAPDSWPEPANERFLFFPRNGNFNRYCFLVNIGNIILGNPAITRFRASIGTGSYWEIATNEGGVVSCGFNDEDDNNKGNFSQIMTIVSVSVAVKRQFGALPRDLQEAVADLVV